MEASLREKTLQVYEFFVLFTLIFNFIMIGQKIKKYLFGFRTRYFQNKSPREMFVQKQVLFHQCWFQIYLTAAKQ